MVPVGALCLPQKHMPGTRSCTLKVRRLPQRHAVMPGLSSTKSWVLLLLSKPIQEEHIQTPGGPMKGYQIIGHVLSLTAPTPIHECESFTAYPIINREKHPVHKSSTRTVLLTGDTSQKSSSGHGPGFACELIFGGFPVDLLPVMPFAADESLPSQPLTTGYSIATC